LDVRFLGRLVKQKRIRRGAVLEASVELIDTIAGEKILDTAAPKMNTSRLKTKEAGLATGLCSEKR
jgi:hypothetical protein